FPNTPAVNDTVTGAGGVVYKWDGVKWVISASAGSALLIAKSDLHTFTTTDARLAVGINNQALIANSVQTTGLQWAAVANSFNGRAGAVVPTSGDYSAAQVTNAVSILGSYANPAWITSLDWSKITGVPAGVGSPLTTKGDVYVYGA